MAYGSGKARTSYKTKCSIHGVQDRNSKNFEQLTVSAPTTKRQRKDGGCPKCKRTKP